jgi:type II restriction/modification system DNA methylase subunit YeeA
MNKTQLKNFAVSARRDLLEKVALRAKIFGIDEKNDLKMEEKFGQVFVNGTGYPWQMKTAFNSLASQLKTKGYEQLIEEAAYTWFNRIIAIRYMEVHDFLPSRVNILSSKTGKSEPDILTLFETVDLDVDIPDIKDKLNQGGTEEAYRKLFIAQCNALNKILPFLFEKINDYTELLLPDFLLDSESVISNLTKNEALTESFLEVEVIGWLYQFYNSEPKDKVFANLKKNKKIEKYDIPAATQLFTPKWIVQYMVENSLGQLWMESYPESSLKKNMEFFIEPAAQEEVVKKHLKEMGYKNISIEEITIIDPCVGSGHILVYSFDILFQMYEEAGYPVSDIPKLILEKNLYGLDIDTRATQLATFSLIMKARSRSRSILRKKIKFNIYSIEESNHLDKEGIIELLSKDDEEKEELQHMLETFYNGKLYGTMLQMESYDYKKYIERIDNLEDTQLTVETFEVFNHLEDLRHLLTQSQLLVSSFDISITNPPYMGTKGMSKDLSEFLKVNFPDSKSDLFAVFKERLQIFTKPNGFYATINQHSWMFLSSYENLRKKFIRNSFIYSMLHLGIGTFPELNTKTVQSTAYVARNTTNTSYIATYFRLTENFNVKDKIDEFFKKKNLYLSSLNKFANVPGNPIVYWASDEMIKAFQENPTLDKIAEPRQGLATSDNDRFLRIWYEVNYQNIGFSVKSPQEAIDSTKKWFPYNKGGDFRKWYGNQTYIINWENNGEEIKNYAAKLYKSYTRTIKNINYYFKEGITWSLISLNFGGRYTPSGFIFDIGGPTLYPDKKDMLTILSFLCSKVAFTFLSILNPTLNFQVGNIKSLPIVKVGANKRRIEELAINCINIEVEDWDASEVSWNFKTHPFIYSKNKTDSLSSTFEKWLSYTTKQFDQIKRNEEELNQIFINLYHLHSDLLPEVPDNEITTLKADRINDTKSFLSYFIGCVLGRYSLDFDGIAFAGGNWDWTKYKSFYPSKHGLIQFTDEQFFEDDIIVRLREFLSSVFGYDSVEKNLEWLAGSLELKQNESPEERLRRYFLDEFFKDHCQVYQKRPIYWLVDSGKQKGLRTLIYMHRYQPDTMATIRFEHLQEIQAKYHYEISAVDARIVNPNLSATEKRELEKRKTDFQKRLDELLEFDKKLAEYANAQISIDLDDGVNVNYQKFEKVLAKIK